MRICFVVNGNSAGTVKARYAQWFAERGHEVHFVTPRKNPLDIPGIQEHHVSTFIPLRLFQLKKILKEIKPDVVHAFNVTISGFLCSLTGVHPLVLGALGSDISIDPEKSWFRRKAVQHALGKADVVHTTGEDGKNRLLELGCTEEKIFVRSRGIDVNLFSPGSRDEKLRSRLLGDDKKFIVSCIRTMEEQYNIPVLLEAASLVLKKRQDVLFNIVGGGSRLQEYKDAAASLGTNVCFVGQVPYDDVARHTASSDICVDPFYRMEGGGGIGLFVSEAMGCGLPVVVTHRAGLESMKDGENCLFFKWDDPGDLVDKILWLLDRPAAMRSIGAEARSTALEEENWDENTKQIEELYRKLAPSTVIG